MESNETKFKFPRAKIDYYTLTYQILSYLFTCLKNGEKVDPEMLTHDSPLLDITEKYWHYLITNLTAQEYVVGLDITYDDNNEVKSINVENCVITPKGIEYIYNNTTAKKIYRFIKEAKSITR